MKIGWGSIWGENAAGYTMEVRLISVPVFHTKGCR